MTIQNSGKFYKKRFRRSWLQAGTIASLVLSLAVIANAEESVAKEESTSNEKYEPQSLEDAPVFSKDPIEDSMFDAMSKDFSCSGATDCYSPPDSTIETIEMYKTAAPSSQEDTVLNQTAWSRDMEPLTEAELEICLEQEDPETANVVIDKHWGSNPKLIKMRDRLRAAGAQLTKDNRRPPIFLIPGLAATRLVAWRQKKCRVSDIKIQDNVWLNLNLILQMSTIDPDCFMDCMGLGLNQSDTDDYEVGCKLRPDEGLDAISSLSPGGIGSQALLGRTNTVYAWLMQWLADNLGYDVSNIIGLPYDWRLSPEKMEDRDGFLTLMKKRIEAAVRSNGEPGIVVAHSMGNMVFRYFLEWLRVQMRQEAHDRIVRQQRRRAAAKAVVKGEEMPGWIQNVEGDLVLNEEEDGQDEEVRRKQLLELAQIEGDNSYIEWMEQHIWTYVGLSAPMLGAVNPVRAVISGENMGLPITDEVARFMELSFGSTNTVIPISSKLGFCDDWTVDEGWDESASSSRGHEDSGSRLACLDDIMNEIEWSTSGNSSDPWERFPVLKQLLRHRVDWDSNFPMISIKIEKCQAKEKPPCERNSTIELGALDAFTGRLFEQFNRIWKEENEPLLVKRDQLLESYWDRDVPNILNRTWDRPHIKHVIMAYGVDIPTEVGYTYTKKDHLKKPQFDGIPTLEKIIREEANGELTEERLDRKGVFTKNKKERFRETKAPLHHSGDGSVPYLSLCWAQTWLLHAARALKHDNDDPKWKNPLDYIHVSHRPQGAMDWVEGPPERNDSVAELLKTETDTGTMHPHGTKYKPEMQRFHSVGKSRKTGIFYSTTVIEAIGVEHKETTRNYDILAAVFSEVLKHMHDDLGLV